MPGPARGRSIGLRAPRSESFLYDAFVWPRGAVRGPKRRFPARAVVLLKQTAKRKSRHAILTPLDEPQSPPPRGRPEVSLEQFRPGPNGSNPVYPALDRSEPL
jgi:hypothetical protein